MNTQLSIYSVGHGTRDIHEFVSLLLANQVKRLVDIRSYPGSSRYPHFNKEAMGVWLDAHNIEYFHLPLLGGRRKRATFETQGVNAGWQNESFGNYADYTLTTAYQQGIADLLRLAEKKPTAYMCAEILPWRCHRLLVSNTLVSAGHRVEHIVSPNVVTPHQLGRWGARCEVKDGRLIYPAETNDKQTGLFSNL